MLTDQQKDYLKQVTRTCQIIVGALALGVIVFAGVVLAQEVQPPEQDKTEVLTIVGVIFALVAIVLAVLVPKMVVFSMRRLVLEGKPILLPKQSRPIPLPEELGEAGPLAIVYQTQLIVGAAILEGAAFMNLVAYMLGQQTMNLGLAALLLIALFFKFPTLDRVEQWVEGQLKVIEEMRSFR